MFGFLCSIVTLDYFFCREGQIQKQKVERIIAQGKFVKTLVIFFESKSFILGTQGGVIMPVAF
jgi:hypothetical protein